MSEPNTNPLPLLIRARELIAAGWGKGSYYDPDTGCYCAAGAIRVAAKDCIGGDSYSDVVSAYLYTTWALAAQIDPGVTRGGAHKTVITWNDAPGRSQAEVLALFDRAIAAGGGE